MPIVKLSPASALLLLSACIPLARAAPAPADPTTVTLFRIAPEATDVAAATTHLTVLGVNDEGGTTYVEELIYTDMVSWSRSHSFVGSDSDPSWVRTTEQIGEPFTTTRKDTFVQDATRVSGSDSISVTFNSDHTQFLGPSHTPPVGHIDHYCDFVGEASTEARCIVVVEATPTSQEGVGLFPFTQTNTFAAVPWATIEVSEGGAVKLLGGAEEGNGGDGEGGGGEDGQEGAAVSVTARGSVVFAAAVLSFVML
ncbi:hypothetical protein BDV98DRAFT_575979 [Pterulicium gracile]|uniref:GPI anchored protein n=1 Tax=Pterulicium gracile TaxID=1884261 RepID=A0A5C3QDR0_9AGAR|nr:hypothetical protein BDV98DRAFT_575979 [Pterula gracilis]